MTTFQIALVAFAALAVLVSWLVLAAVAIAGRPTPRIGDVPEADEELDHIGQLPEILFPSSN